jgi:two-component system cell cycle response regulator DivK
VERKGPHDIYAALNVPVESPSGKVTSRDAHSHSARRVLIADDTLDTRDLYEMYLRQCGYDVQTVTDGQAAVQMALEWQPDVIVLDLSMPGLDGITATKRIKDDPRPPPFYVIVLTGFPHHAAQRAALDAGADVFLAKPCLPEELARQVQRLVDSSRKLRA